MSLVIRTQEADTPSLVLDYAYTRADMSNETVVIYRRAVDIGNLTTVMHYEYIATGVDSEQPEGSVLWTSIGPRSPLYDRTHSDNRCC